MVQPNRVNLEINGNHEFGIISEIEDLDDHDSNLKSMNQIGSEAGLSFKKGPSNQNTSKCIAYKSWDRNQREKVIIRDN